MSISPRTLAEELPDLPPGDEFERFAGYAVMGVPFATGHYLALRHFPASSIGPGYDSVWHRDPAGRWVMYISAAPESSCPRYFGRALAESRTADITITWTGPNSFGVTVDDTIDWSMTLARSLATRAMTAAGSLLPAALWRNDRVLTLMSRVAGPLLGVGRIGLTGETPSGHSFRANPRRLWAVERSRATVDGVDVGPPGPLPEQARLGGFWLPQRGVFAIGETYFTPL
ncbi:hypothetical protein EGT67_13345 [Prescottella agglutinans]|uniref:Uncharacterized protein n=1 Tax=Prescottella agglutinans TaxID=1644129 RepID=A0A438BDQ4_9NOCA|nr:hypothetical protein [Prescottella agglutinans]RVW09130.1 hypothetical protein EGT67_13345 [Prescottella agglutinans]